MYNLANVYQDEILLEEFLKPMKITAYRFSKSIGKPQTRTSQNIKGKRGNENHSVDFMLC
jgi:plasmid maintenance system antidote protein VapI